MAQCETWLDLVCKSKTISLALTRLEHTMARWERVKTFRSIAISKMVFQTLVKKNLWKNSKRNATTKAFVNSTSSTLISILSVEGGSFTTLLTVSSVNTRTFRIGHGTNLISMFASLLSSGRHFAWLTKSTIHSRANQWLSRNTNSFTSYSSLTSFV